MVILLWLVSFGVAQIAVCVPFVCPEEAYSMYGIEVANTIPSSFEEYDMVFLAVAHAPFLELNDYHDFYTPQRSISEKSKIQGSIYPC